MLVKAKKDKSAKFIYFLLFLGGTGFVGYFAYALSETVADPMPLYAFAALNTVFFLAIIKLVRATTVTFLGRKPNSTVAWDIFASLFENPFKKWNETGTETDRRNPLGKFFRK